MSTALSWTQFHTNRSKSELGIMLGGSYYIGDLNQFYHFRNTHLAGGLVYRYNIHSRTSFRANFNYGKVSASDANASNEVLQNRNLSFESSIYELGAGLEFNYFPFQLGHDDYKGTAYLLAEIAVFKMNPMTTTDGGDDVELQPLGTEGQGTALSDRNKYGLTQLSIPLGIGCKLSLGDRFALSLEYGIRKTFTDYLDDVHAGRYADRSLLTTANGPLAAELSNRSLDANPYGKRGNESTKDWYAFCGAMITMRLGQPQKCFQH